MNIQDINNVIKQLDNVNIDDTTVPMRTGKSKSWLGEYHWVQPPMPRSQESHVKRTSDSEAITWCSEHFGESGVRWFELNNKFYFQNPEDQSLFVLRWS